jgi:serine/threonine protein kinase
MALEPGTTLGPYSVTAKIGEGGMGEVYRARDTKLGRDVALKVLPAAFTDDPDRLARFEREAKVLASLNHTNIGHLYGLEEADGQKALVLELVEGPTLADRIAQGPIPVDEALPIAKQIAEALEAAHEAGVIHRDLKPANVKVKSDGTVKVLDFGLAKALDPSPEGDPSQSPTLTAAPTQTGVIMGTAAYMSPEQARGKPVDKRADVWAFGVVLYEMLTGQRAFQGETSVDILAGVIERSVAFDLLPASLPSSLRVMLRRCITRERKSRLRDIGDARLEITELLTPSPVNRGKAGAIHGRVTARESLTDSSARGAGTVAGSGRKWTLSLSTPRRKWAVSISTSVVALITLAVLLPPVGERPTTTNVSSGAIGSSQGENIDLDREVAAVLDLSADGDFAEAFQRLASLDPRDERIVAARSQVERAWNEAAQETGTRALQLDAAGELQRAVTLLEDFQPSHEAVVVALRELQTDRSCEDELPAVVEALETLNFVDGGSPGFLAACPFSFDVDDESLSFGSGCRRASARGFVTPSCDGNAEPIEPYQVRFSLVKVGTGWFISEAVQIEAGP